MAVSSFTSYCFPISQVEENLSYRIMTARNANIYLRGDLFRFAKSSLIFFVHRQSRTVVLSDALAGITGAAYETICCSTVTKHLVITRMRSPQKVS